MSTLLKKPRTDYYESRRRLGLCWSCSDKSEPGRVRCRKCAKKMAEYAKRYSRPNEY